MLLNRAKQERLEAIVSRPMFFIVGCQKSGTTWLQGLLNGHPEICCRGEGRIGDELFLPLVQAIRHFNGRQLIGAEFALDDAQIIEVFRFAAAQYFSNWLPERVPACIGEKTPQHALLMPVLHAAFPQAKFLHIIRDGRDGVVSGWFHNLRSKPEEFRRRFPTVASYTEYFVKHHWVRYIQSVRQFAAAHPGTCMEVRYEDLLESGPVQTEAMLRFLGVDASPDNVQRCVAAGSFESMSGGRRAGQEDAGSHFRKGQSGDWRNHLDAEALRAFASTGGREFLEGLGYAWEEAAEARAA